MNLIPPDAPSERTPPAADARLLTRRDRSSSEEPATPAPALRIRLPHFGPRGWRVLRRIFIASALLAAVFVIGGFGTTLWLRHAMRASLPQIDGTLHVTGLNATVSVTRDAQGVPSIHAATLDDVLFAQGYVTAQDRLFQMDALRRHAAGELAEVLGSGLVEHDRLQRYLQIRATADRAVALLPPDQLHQLEAYARGVNAFIATHRDDLPVEFHMLHYAPAAWTPRDSLLVALAMNQDLSTEYPQKLQREALTGHLPADVASDLYPVGSWRDKPPAQPTTDLTTPREIEQVPLDNTQSSAKPYATPQELLRYGMDLCNDCKAGSNNWAVAGSRTATGAPLVSNDMHLALNAPDIWYEAALHTNDGALDVTGFTLPGVPFVIVGRNAHVAWGFTNLLGDVQDVRIEHVRGSGPGMQFERPDGSWATVAHHDETIKVRGGRDVALDVMTTEETVGAVTMPTPIISPLYRTEKRTLSLAWTIYDATAVTAPFFGVDTAQDGASLVAAFAGFGGPSLNLVYADEHHIGYHVVGRIPVRGPAEKHPRATDGPALPQGAPPADEEDGSDGPEARMPMPRLIEAAWTRPVRRRHVEPAKKPAKPAKAAAQKPKPAPEPVLIAAPVVDYTIGSPIMPVPVDALDASQQWSGYIPYNALPFVVDPASGVIATANARVTPSDYPYFIANDWIDPYRVERIYQMLRERSGLTAADMLAVQNDVHSDFDRVMAQRLAYAMDHASAKVFDGHTKQLRQAADLLRSWDGSVAADSSAAAIVSTTRAALWPMLLTAQIRKHDGGSEKAAAALAELYTWHERNTALELLLQHTPARWLPTGYADWDDFLTAAVLRALQQNGAPGDLSHWRYGSVHPVEIAHPMLGSRSALSRMLGVATGTGRHPADGDATTVKSINLHYGPSERFTADLGNSDATVGNITTGESGNPGSAWYLDQFGPWLKGTSFPLPLEHPQVQHTLQLVP